MCDVNTSSEIARVFVCGARLRRSGKSFLMNLLFGFNANAESDSGSDHDGPGGFQVGHTVQACTRGLWMWKRPTPVTLADGSSCTLLVIDSEGLGATDKTTNYDDRIFTLTALVASVLVYNSSGCIDEKSIQRLTFISRLSQLLTNAGDDGGSSHGQVTSHDIFPAFVWVLRDFALQLQDASGKEISPMEYMERSLCPQPGSSAVIKQRNRITGSNLRTVLYHFTQTRHTRRPICCSFYSKKFQTDFCESQVAYVLSCFNNASTTLSPLSAQACCGLFFGNVSACR